MKKTIKIKTVDEITIHELQLLMNSSGDTYSYFNILFGLTEEEYNNLNKIDKQDLEIETYNIIDRLYKLETEIITEFKFENMSYKLQNKYSLTNKDFADLFELQKDSINNLAEICAILYKPYKKKFLFFNKKVEIREEDYDMNVILFKCLPAKLALSALFFFAQYKLNYLEKMMKKLKKQTKI